MPQPIFFQPRNAWVGDIIPFEEGGEFKLFYLHEERVEPKPGTPWHLVTTHDLIHFDDQGLAFEHGGFDDPDFNVYTGSIVRDGSTHHLFYTGQNPRHVGSDGLPLQLVMHATSDDGMGSWTRHPEQSFGAPVAYESADWRDPFVFHDDDAGVWRMLIAARHVDGPERRRGVIAQCTSTDLVNWQIADPFWDPGLYVAHECPEVFKWGNWWYLVYSEFSDNFTTRYRMAKSLEGPWQVPEYDSIDGRAYYASKTAERDGRRFFFGWIASRAGSRDDGAWQWAGTLSTLEARQRADGTLAFGFVPEVFEMFTETLAISLTTRGREQPLLLAAPDSYEAVISDGETPATFCVSVTFDIEAGTTECGLLLRSSADGDSSYVVRLEPQRGRMVFDRWPRRRTGGGQWEISGDIPFLIELERPCDLRAGEHSIDVIVENDLCVVNLDGRTTLSTRIYDHPRGRIGAFVGEGTVTVRDFRVATRPGDVPESSAVSSVNQLERQFA
jgi:beta-fructofuranosidase